MTKYLILGYGSIGKRHAANLRQLRPDAHIITADPVQAGPGLHYPDWRQALADHADADGAIIASPTAAHFEQWAECLWANRMRGVYVEKPICLPSELEPVAVSVAAVQGSRCAVGYQYRFHPAMPRIRALAERHHEMRFTAADNLLDRYGPDVAGVMAAHPIDTACWCLGPAVAVHLISDGISLSGEIEHAHGVSRHRYTLNAATRLSMVESGREAVSLPADNRMYLDALDAWLAWVDGGERDPRTATLADGLRGVEIMAQIRYRETA